MCVCESVLCVFVFMCVSVYVCLAVAVADAATTHYRKIK